MPLLNLHLGDNADFNDGEFASATYVGLRVSLPIRMSRVGASNQLIVNTSAIETLADWQAHTVSIDYSFSAISRTRRARPWSGIPSMSPPI